MSNLVPDQHALDSACTYGIAGGCYVVAKLADIASVSQSLIVIVTLAIVAMRFCNDIVHYYSKLKKWWENRDDTPPAPPIE